MQISLYLELRTTGLMNYKESQGNFGDDKNILYLDCGVGFTDIYFNENGCSLLFVNDTNRVDLKFYIQYT